MSKLEVFYDFFWSKCHGILSNWTYTNTVSSFQAICRVRKKMENKIVFKIIQICLLITAFGLFLGYRCEGNGCKFSTHGVYNFTAVIFALLFSMWVEWLRKYCLETKTSISVWLLSDSRQSLPVLEVSAVRVTMISLKSVVFLQLLASWWSPHALNQLDILKRHDLLQENVTKIVLTADEVSHFD